MRTSLLLVAVVVSGCGGNWSNSDLVFTNALPRSVDLKSNIPASASGSPLTGVATRRDGLMVGDASNAWALSKGAAKDFNGIVDALLGIVDQVRKVAPTSRTATSRTWGPFPDANNTGREVQVVIERVDETSFAWRVESRATGAAFIKVVIGDFLASDSATARIGQGHITVPVKDFRDVVKVDPKIAALDAIDIAYDTSAWPHQVEIQFTAAPNNTSGLSALGYTSKLFEDGSGSMRFLSTSTDPNVTQLEITTGWKATGNGRGFGVVRAGNYTGANVTECWGTSQTVVYYSESWTGGTTSGSPGDCVTLPGF
ncbi:MAG: hypothetical protein U0228_28360 [Myxococcaceae bacterium]